MPSISSFYGITIYIYYNDHNEPHLHAIYGEYKGFISINSGVLLEGSLPPSAKKLIKEWIEKHTNELKEDWELAKEHKKLKKIAPLK